MKKALWWAIGAALVGFFLWDGSRNHDVKVAAEVTIGEMEVVPLPSLPRRKGEPPAPKAVGLRDTLCSLRWISFAPTNFDPTKGIFPSEESLLEDLQVLRQAGFNGLITYGANVLEPHLTQLAQKVGFQGIIAGVWDPRSREELNRARDAARFEIVVGLAVGNEGLGVRYDRIMLEAAISELRRTTGKPVTTTEEIEDYADPWLLELGDFVLPNAHPYWAGITEPHHAAAWTEEQFRRLAARTSKPILFKEVGLPSAGDPHVSEQKQAEYYRLLENSRQVCCFAYFEAFDQTSWKQWPPVEPHWGLFRQDRSPKLVVQQLLTAR